VICFGEVSRLILVEVVADAFAVLKKQTAIDNLKGVDVDLDDLVARHAVSAIAAKGGLILRRVGLKKIAVFFGGEVVNGAVMFNRKFGAAVHARWRR